tara:strand:+ start:19678 stop:19878 length:201 start_codon:yes stop_codon:yes gene_type:complete
MYFYVGILFGGFSTLLFLLLKSPETSTKIYYVTKIIALKIKSKLRLKKNQAPKSGLKRPETKFKQL